MEKTFETCFPEVMGLMEEFTGSKFKPDWNFIIPIIHRIETMGYTVKVNKLDGLCCGTIYWKSEKITDATHKDTADDASDRFKCSILLLYYFLRYTKINGFKH